MRIRKICLALSMVLLVCTTGFAEVSYILGTETPLLNAAFYAGDPSGAGTSDGAEGAGRMAFFGSPSPNGSKVAISAVNFSTFRSGLYVVDVGNPDSWDIIAADVAGSPVDLDWTPDSSRIFIDGAVYDVVTGNLINSDIVLHGYTIHGEASMTHKASNNWVVVNAHDSPGHAGHEGNILTVPIQPDGSEDLSREPVFITKNFNDFETRPPLWPEISNDGTALTFFEYERSPNTSTPDIGDVYVIHNLSAIINAPKELGTDISTLAIDGISSPLLTPIRTSESSHFATIPDFSQDKSLIFWSEDFSDIWTNNDFFGTIFISDFDIMLSKADNSTADTRFEVPGNQFGLVPFPGGIRMYYVKDVGGVLQAFITNLETVTDFDSSVDDLVENATEAEIGGETVALPFTLTDNAVQTTEVVEVADSSGTVINMPAEQVINFPAGSTATTISISTPVAAVEAAELPLDAPIDAIPVVREFGPADTEFFPPIPVTISYTDAEVAGLDELSLVPYLYNDATGIFDIPVAESDIVEHDTVNNTITFLVEHFSIYGLGGAEPVEMPVSSPQAIWVLVVLLALIGLGYTTRKRMGNSQQ